MKAVKGYFYGGRWHAATPRHTPPKPRPQREKAYSAVPQALVIRTATLERNSNRVRAHR